MRNRAMTLVTSAVLALGSCGGGDEAPTVNADSPLAFYETMRSEAFVQRDGAALDVDAAIARLPDWLSASYDAVRFDERSGATIISDFRLHLTEDGDVAVEIDTLRFWGADFDALFDRFEGRRLDETLRIFDRMDAEGVALVGLEAAMVPLFEAYAEAATETVADFELTEEDRATIEQEFDEAFDIQFERYDFTMGRNIIDGFDLRPWTYVAIDDEDEGLTVLRQFAAGWNAAAYEAWAVFDMTADMALTQFDLTSTVDFTMAAYGARGVEGGDIKEILYHDMRSGGDTVFPDFSKIAVSETDEPPMTLVPIEMTADTYRHTDLRVANLLDHAARGEIPDLATEDLFSLGLIEMDGVTYDIAGTSAFSMGKMVLDMREFAGILPTKLLLDTDDVSYNLGGLVDVMAAIELPEGEELPFEVSEIGEVLDKYEARTLTGDAAFEWVADPDTGAAALRYDSDQPGWGSTRMSFDFTLPDFDTIKPFLKVDGAGLDDEDFNKVFDKHYTINGGEFVMVDVGGMDKMAGLAIDLGKLGADVQPELKFITGYTPDTLRQFMSAAVMFGVSNVPPELEDLDVEGMVTALSQYLAEGGELALRFAPPEPVQAADFDDNVFEDDPAAVLKMLGFSVEHTPPAN